jgi:putative FmdB family regulatory protein
LRLCRPYNPFIIMPIYAYKCGSCGFAKDVLQKISDAVLTECPSCGQSSFTKQLTAAGFQLKGSGWYATDFKGGSSATTAAPAAGNDTATTPAPTEAPATKTDTPAAAASGCGGGCACHA